MHQLNKHTHIHTHKYIYINSSAVKGEEAHVLLALYHCFCSPGQMHCWRVWGVQAQAGDGQPVFNVAVESVVQRLGSADCNHHRRRCLVQGCLLSKQTVPVIPRADPWKSQTSTGVIQAHAWRHAIVREFSPGRHQTQQLQPGGWMPFKGMFCWALLILLLWGLRRREVKSSASLHFTT